MRRYIYALLLAVSAAAAGKYVYVSTRLNWSKAQEYCREHFTELAPISGDRDMHELHRALGGSPYFFSWVGLHRGETAGAPWCWSGGSNATYLPWAHITSYASYASYDKAALCLICSGNKYGLHEKNAVVSFAFFCLNLVVVKQPRTWEGALEYCREQHDDLASLASETEILLARREIGEAQAGEPVWVGLRHFGSRWLWLRGEPLSCDACDPSLDPLQAGQTGADADRGRRRCYTCGSLSYGGELQGLDCQTELHFLCY